MDLEYGKPVPSDDPKYKMMVRVYNPETGRDRIVRFGDGSKGMPADDAARREYLEKSALYTKRGTDILTKDDPFTANYWARRFIFNSGEKKVNVAPPPGVVAGSPEKRVRRRKRSPRPPASIKAAMSPSRRSPRKARSPKKGAKTPKKAGAKKAGSPKKATSPRRSPKKATSPRRSPKKATSPRRSPKKATSPRRSPKKAASPKPASIKAARSPIRSFVF